MVYIRADANAYIGSGHIMRCMAIAEELVKAGETVTFLLADDVSSEKVKQMGCPFLVLHTDWSDLNKDMDQLIQFIIGNKVEKLLVDSYYISKETLHGLSRYTKVMYIDDYSNDVIDVQSIVHYGLIYEQEFYKEYNRLEAVKEKKNHTRLLLGSQYIPLRKEFQDIVFDDRLRKNNILIMSGGTDTYNVMGTLLYHIIDDRQYDSYHFHIIIGLYNEFKNDIIRLAENRDNITTYFNVGNMAELMKSCAVSISAGGSTLYELFSARTPTICYTFADNQNFGAEMLGSMGYVCYIGDIRGNVAFSAKTILDRMEELYWDKAGKREMVEKMIHAVDGKGAYRIARELINL